uniref:Exosome subunit n=1 Tax=uncultured euryarchaeote Rifle_16ft_4_minimus_309 TaxID=1665192 RepID=A0A0H4T2X5_9EURY|nr:hypothetical protein [uncultured euryarchaeote Rifle_16ft_4_minimus_309]
MAKLPIHWIEVRVHCHATEEEPRVLQALETACPVGGMKREILEGHFGNPLVRLTRRVDRAADIAEVWTQWTSTGLLAKVAHDVDARVDDEGVLHFRIDKQRAYAGALDLAIDPDTMDVRVKLMAFPAKPEEARRVARVLAGGGP